MLAYRLPSDTRCDGDSELVSSVLIVSGGGASEVFDAIEEAIDEVSRALEPG